MERIVSLPTLKVVTVDDSPIIVNRLQQLLNEMDHVDLLGNAEDIQSALMIIEEQKPHVVLLDINLTGDKPRNGIDLLSVLRKTYPVMKIIMLTNLSGERYREICKSFGADYFFDKSEDFDRIPETLKEIALSARSGERAIWVDENSDLWS